MKKLGIIGGGQLGRMISFYAQKMGIKTVIYTNEIDAPATLVTNETIIGEYDDFQALKKFCDQIDLATFEFENIPFATAEFVSQNSKIYPSPEILKITQNRILEKNFLQNIKVKTVDFKIINDFSDIELALKNFHKAILKTAIMGYDGKGQALISNLEEARIAYDKFQNFPLILEKFCKFECEVSVIVARSLSGEIKVYDPLTNIHKNGILDRSIYPAKISAPQKFKVQKIASKIAESFNLVGILAVEFFVVDNDIYVNEMAPRPHNSGHFSMDACITSQFEQLIRAITDMALGDTRFHSRGQMINLIGDEVLDLAKYLKNPRAKIHLYGKNNVKAGRKMGHINILK